MGFDWEGKIVFKTKERRFERKVREAFEIQLQQKSPHSDHGLDQDDGQYVTTNFWKPNANLREDLQWYDVNHGQLYDDIQNFRPRGNINARKENP